MNEWKDAKIFVPDTNSVGKCLRKCEVKLLNGEITTAYFCIAGWFENPTFYLEYEIRTPVLEWRYANE